MNNLEVITLTKRSLKEALANNKYWNGTISPPFSINKAKWILENNRADEDDVLAVLGYDGDYVVAMVYLVPDLVKGKDGISKKIFWSQRWWVSDKYKDTVLSAYVKNISHNACNNQVIIKFLGDNTKAYYEKQSFSKFSKRKRYIILFSLDRGLLIHKKSSLKKITPILKLMDSFSRRVIAIINNIKSSNSTGITFEKVKLIDNDTWGFLEKHCSEDIVPKSKEYINWQISNSQYQVVHDKKGVEDHKCLLGSISNKIYNLNIVIKFENEIVGFLSAFVTNNRFVIRYFLATDVYYNDCLDVLIKNFISSKCTIIQTENSKLGELISSKCFKVYSDVKELVSLIHDDVNIDLENSIITDQDGFMF